MFRRELIIAAGGLISVAALSGCGFRPLHGTDNRQTLNDARILIEPIADREGQILHNALRDRLNPRGQPADPTHRLQVNLTVSVASTPTADSVTARRAATLTATYFLRDIAANEIVTTSSRAQRVFFAQRSDPRVVSEEQENAVAQGLAIIAEDVSQSIQIALLR